MSGSDSGGPSPVEAFFVGHPLGLAVHDRVAAIAAPMRPTVHVTRSQVTFRRRRGFAWIWLPGRWLRRPEADVVLSIALPRPDASPRWKQVVQTAPKMWMHHLEVRAPGDLDAEVEAWLGEAAEAAG